MVEINLLPWREQAKRYNRKQTQKIICLPLLLILALMFTCYEFLSWQLNQYALRVTELKNEINQIHSANQRETAVAEVLKPHFPLTDFFSQLGQSAIKPVCFTEIKRAQELTQFTGMSRSATDFTNYLQEWRAASLFSEIQIKSIEEQVNGVVTFSFTSKDRQ